jgi:DNA ligase (NAD+)
MNALKEQIKKANEAYRYGNPIISDEEYDILLEKLEDLMGFIEFEDFKLSLTEVDKTGNTVKLDYVLGSLTKLKYEESDKLYAWIKKNEVKSIFASLKVDGCSFNASWRNGVLVMCSSRGDGDTGTDWTEKATYILPNILPDKIDLDIRGEFTITGDAHETLGFKTRRNGTVGIMNELKVVPAKLQFVRAIAYEVLSGELSIKDQFQTLQSLGFRTPDAATYPMSNQLHEHFKAFYVSSKETVDYDIDGIVISSPSYQREDVFFPEAKVAFKINSEGVPAKVTGVEWNISKGGLLKPVVLIDPTTINGTTIGRVTGFNAQYIIDNEIQVGTTVYIVRKGEVIPGIVKVMNP